MFYRYDGESLEKSRCKTAWMGPIPRKASQSDILKFFKDYSPSACKIIKKSETNRFAFIYFPSETLRDAAISAKCNEMFKGVQVVVNRSFNAYSGERIGGRERYDYELDEITKY